MKNLHILSYIVMWIGGINWGLIGFFNYNLVDMVFGMNVAKWIYMLVGVATVYVASTHMSDCKICSKK